MIDWTDWEHWGFGGSITPKSALLNLVESRYTLLRLSKQKPRHTLTFFLFLAYALTFFGICSDILSGIYADILLGILSGIYSDILSESILAFYLVVYLASLTWALLDLNRECQISVGTARPHCEGQIWSSQLRSGSAQ
jgi:hypothetical protein